MRPGKASRSPEERIAVAGGAHRGRRRSASRVGWCDRDITIFF